MKRTLVGVCLVVAAAGTSFAEPNADEIVNGAARYISAAQSFRVSAAARLDLTVEDYTEQMAADYTLVYRKPDAFSLRLVDPDVEVIWITDGVSFTMYIPSFGQYKVHEIVPDPGEVIGDAGIGPMSAAALFLAELVEEHPFSGLSAAADSSSYAGLETIDGVDCHRLRFVHGTGSWDLWVDAGDRPLVRRIAPDVSEMYEDLQSQGVDAQITFHVDLTDWAIDGAVDADFVFTPDANIRKVAQFQPPEPDAESMQLLGKAAPEFSLELLDGGTLDLASKRGNEIVILDFWATWCGPCRRGMPILERLSEEFADGDVRLYAVNLQEDPDEIRTFLKKQGMNITVALDTEGAVAEHYMVDAIPQTVVIGKDGRVQVVHVGVGPDFEEELRSELSALVKGESLVD